MKLFNSKFKQFCLAILMLIVPISSIANDQATALLQHGDTSTAFYGVDAFVQAMQAADHGDTIYLSSGLFNQTTVTKAVTIQGNGIPTKIQGNISVNIEDETPGLNVESIYFQNEVNINSNHKDTKFSRCSFAAIFRNNANTENFTLNQCDFRAHYYFDKSSGETKHTGYDIHNNCIFRTAIYAINASSNPVFNNCILYSFASSVYSGTFNNCIILNSAAGSGKISTYNNTIIPADGTKPHVDATLENVTYLTKAEISALFQNTDTYSLNEDAASKYIGTDGNQVGLYGGAYPFTRVPAIPQIKSVKLDSKVGADGKLNITIEAEAVN